MPRLSVRRAKKMARRLPGGGWTLHLRKKERRQVTCTICGKPLGGISLSRVEARSLSKSLKSVSRIYGGVLCSTCLKMKIEEAVISGS
ncbi:MAG: hypothetical protein QXK12_03520 [Candidatus Nezhaarchaeales archaeon]